MNRIHRLTLVVGVATFGAAAQAQDTAPPKDLTINTSIGAVSDYRFRGISLSGKAPSVQGSIEAAHVSGFYGGAWASTLGDADYADVEVDLYGGWSGALGAATVDIGVQGYLYPDASDLDYLEFYGSAAWTLGPATATLGAAYAPDQRNIGRDDNIYVYGDLAAGIPSTPLTLRAHLGYEDGGASGVAGDKLDWSLGAEYVLGPVVLGASYVDTDIDGVDEADAGVVFSITASF